MKASIQWQQDLLFKGTTDNGTSAILDGNKSEAPSPMEMVLMAAGSCSSVDVVSILKKSRQTITDVTVEVAGERVDTVPAVFKSIHLHFIITGDHVSEKHVQRAVSLSADKYCSVSIMLSGSVNVTHSYEIKQG